MQRIAIVTAVLAFASFSGPPVGACGWGGCSDGYGSRKPARVYGYYKNVRPSAPTRYEPPGAPPIPGGANAQLLSPEVMPGPGPTLFGPPTAPAYYYNAPPVRKWRRRSR